MIERIQPFGMAPTGLRSGTNISTTRTWQNPKVLRAIARGVSIKCVALSEPRH